MNFRLLLSITFITALVACGGAEERKAVYMEKAKSSIESGDFDKARIELKNVLQIDPKDGEAYFQLGKVYEKQKDYRKAFTNYRKSEELDPEILENKARLGRLYLLLANDLDEANQRIDFILSKDKTNVEGLLLKAAVLHKNDKKYEAVSIGEKILKRDPGNTDAATFVAAIYTQDKKIQQAITILEVAIQSKPENDQLNNLLAMLLISNKDYERAELIYKAFLEKYPDNRSNYNRLAALYNTTDNKDKAEDLLRASIKNNPNDAVRYLTLVKYIEQTKGKEDAVNELKAAVANNKSLGKLRIALAQYLLLSGDKQSAIDVYKKAVQDFSGELTEVDARVALSALYFNDENFALANEIVEDAISISPNDPKLNFVRARLAIHDKNAEKAILSLRIVIKETPENIDAYFMLVNAYQLENNAEQVESTLNTAYENNKTNPTALLRLTKYYLGRDVEKAEKIIDRYNIIKISDYEGISVKAAILNMSKKVSEAYALAKQLIDLYPDKPNGYLQSIPYLTQKNEINEAVAILENGYISTKDNRKILELLTTLQVSEKKFDIVEKRIKVELNASPDDNALKLLLAKVYMSNDNSGDAETLLNEVIEAQPNVEEPYLLLSHIYRNNNNKKMYKSILVKGKNNVATSYKLPLTLATLYEYDLEYQKAIEIYQEFIKSNPDNLIIINNLTSLLSDYGNGKEDLELAKELIEKLNGSEQPVYLDTIGWVYYKLGDYQNAIEYLSQVVVKAPKVSVFNYHLGMAYKMADDKVKAKVYLEKSLDNNEQFAQKDLAEAALKEL